MSNPSSRSSRNSRKHRNQKCSICGLELKNGVCYAAKKHDPKNKNQFLIAKVDGVIYWTNSVFWRDFF